MNKKLVVIFLLIFSSNVYSQWMVQNIGATRPSNCVFFLNENTGWIAGDRFNESEVFKTTNGGANWIVLPTGVFTRFFSIHFINENTGWIAGESSYLIKTTNGGVNWTIIRPDVQCNVVHFVNSNTGWLVGGTYASISKSTNGGINWVTQRAGDGGMFNIYLKDENTGWAVGNTPQGRVFKTTNGGLNWNSQLEASSNGMHGISFINENTGWVSGNSENILKTTNGGTNWTSVATGALYTIASIVFKNENTGWYIRNNLIVKTTNGGANWIQQINAVNHFNMLFFPTVNTGWAVGGDVGNYVMKTTNGGTTFINSNISEIPDDYLLYQNYPNPFNPVTNIKFSLPQNSFVKLKVFDFAGREVSVIINERLFGGEHNVTFDGINLTSGIYFYKLETEKFSQTKKMILIK